MPLIPDTVIDDVQGRADIAEVIGRYVTLKRAGRHFKALCPFHKEKTPSFMVNTDKQIFHCFGCGVGGNVFSFLMQQDRMTFPEAVRQLADHVGVAVPEPETSPARGETATLAAVIEKAAVYFERLLAHPQQGRDAQAYLTQRGVAAAARRAFRLGVAPPGWRQLLQASQTSGVSVDALEAAGLVIRGAAGPYDRFRNRLIFPIQDVRGRVVGFGGRSLDGQEPKYLNSPETLLYTKGRHLFGLPQAKEAITRQRTAVLVEGYFDCVVLASGGVAHVVSPLGTALTAEQTRLLKRYADTVILAFDADAAGEAATLRGIDLLVETGVDVRVAKFPQRVDPDEYLQTHGQARLEALLAEGQGIFEFLVEQALRRFPGQSTEAKVHAAQFVLPTLARVSNAMLRTEYVRALAGRLGLDEASVAQELAKAQPRSLGGGSPTGAPRRATPVLTRPTGRGPERLLTALVLDDPERWGPARQQLSLEDVTDDALRHILAVASEAAGHGRRPTAAQIISRLQADGHGALVAELVELAQSIDDKDQAFGDCSRRVADFARRHRMDLLRNRIAEAQSHGREDTVEQLLVEYQAQVKGG